MKKIFILSFLVSLFFVSQSNAQWWVDGGNLIWPYGDVTVEKDLNINGKIYMDRAVVDRNTNLFKSIVSDSIGASLHFATSATGTVVAIDSFTAKNLRWNALMGSENFVEISQTAGGHFDDNFIAGGVTNTVNVVKTVGDTVSECYGSRSRIFTGYSNNYVKNYYGYLASIGWWVKLNMQNAYSFYSDGVFFNAQSNTSNFYHFYGDGDYLSYFGGRVEAKEFKLTAMSASPPSSISDTGTVGEIRITSSYVYICVATNSWKRSFLNAESMVGK